MNVFSPHTLLLSTSLIFLPTGLLADSILSPDSRTELSWKLEENTLTYQVSRDDKPFITSSKLGLDWGTQAAGWGSASATTSLEQSTWKPAWGKKASIHSHYREAVVKLTPAEEGEQPLTVIFRVSDEGIAFRYHLAGDSKEPLKIRQDFSEFNFANDGTAWSYNGERENKGPEQISSINGGRRLPMTIRFSKDSYATISEAELVNFSWMDLAVGEGDFSFGSKIEASQVLLPFSTPWRAVVIGDKPGDLIDASWLENLNPPCAIDDPSWIEPGLTLWDWRTWGYKAPDGFEYGLNMASWKRFIDFASKHEISSLLLDANWYGPEFDPEMDPTKSRDHLLEQLPNGEIVRKPAPADWADPIDIPALIKYGKERNVGIFLYINDKARIKYDFEKTLATYQEWGAVGIKYGFMEATNRQGKVNKTNEIIQLCAKYELMCNFHDGPVAPTGDYRTWPNCTTREFCHAQADAKRSFTASTFNTAVFVNMIGGPLDMNNGMFALDGAEKNRPRVFEAIPSTIVGECARTLLTFSGQAIVLDAPESFEAHPELLNFLTAQKQPWKDSATIDGKIGEYLIMHRTAADGTILLGATTNEEARELVIPLTFLGSKPVEALVMQDGDDTSFEKNQEAYQTETRTVSSSDTLTLKLAPGGGACVTFFTGK